LKIQPDGILALSQTIKIAIYVSLSLAERAAFFSGAGHEDREAFVRSWGIDREYGDEKRKPSVR
jgi:hypothetical protein